jgi:hypothetical protein
MESSSFNLERKINEFLDNFNQTASNAIDDELLYDQGLVRSRSKYLMDDQALEMTGKPIRGGSDNPNFVSLAATKLHCSLSLVENWLSVCPTELDKTKRKLGERKKRNFLPRLLSGPLA